MTSVYNLVKNSYEISASAWMVLVSSECGPNKITGARDYLVLTAMEAGFILTTIVGVIETIFWASITLLAKAIHVFIPQSNTVDKVYAQLVTNTFYSVCATTVAIIMIMENFNEIDVKKDVCCPTLLMYNRLAEDYCSSFLHYRLFGESGLLPNLLPNNDDSDDED